MAYNGRSGEINPGRRLRLPLADPGSLRQFLFLTLRVSTVALIVATLVVSPPHVSRLWALALSVAQTQGASTAHEFLLYLDAVRRDAVAWHAACVIANGVVAGVLLKLAVRDWAGGVLCALGVGVLGMVVAEWACARIGFVLPAQVSVVPVGVAFAGAVLTVVATRFLARV